MAKSNFVELMITDEAILNFGKVVFELGTLKSKVEKLIDQETEFGLLAKNNYFQFHSDYVLKLKLHTRSIRNDVYAVNSKVFGFYSLFQKGKNTKYNFTNNKELYRLFQVNNKSNNFIKSIHKLLDNLSDYYYLITDIPNYHKGYNIGSIYEECPNLYTANFSEFIGVNYGISQSTLKRSNKRKLPILVVTLANPILANDIKLYTLKSKSQVLSVFH